MDPEGWVAWNQVTDFSCDGTSLNGKATDNDPFIGSPSSLTIDASAAKTIHLRLKVSATSPAQIFFITNTDPTWNEAKSKMFETGYPGEWVEYRLDFADVPEWTDTVTQIRLDPVNDIIDATFSVDWFRVGSNPHWRPGKFSNALLFDGLDDKVVAPFIPLNDRSFTITAWFKARGLPTYPNDLAMLTQDAEHAQDKCLHVLVRDGRPYFGFYGDDLQGNTVLERNKWYHIACVYNYSENRKLMYINGELDASGPSASAYKGTSGNTEIGYYYPGPWPGTPRSYFNGTLDEVRIYDRALSQKEISAVASSGAIQTQTVSLMNGNSENIIFTWNTSGFVKGNYTLSACAWPVPGEKDTADNDFTGGWVRVSMVGDLCGTGNAWDFVPDGVVDGSDLSIVAKCYGSWPGAQPPMI